MINFISSDKNGWQHVECDDISIPDYGINKIFTDKNCFPFIYGFDNNGKDFVLVGERSSAHSTIFSDFEKELNEIGINSRYKVFCARIWNINSTSSNFPKKVITGWVDDGPKELNSSKSFARIQELLRDQNINISNASIVVESYNDIILEDYEKPENGIYIISVSDYILKNLASLAEIPKEYLREKKKLSSGLSRKKTTWHDLPYRLYRWQSDESKTIKVNQQVLAEIIKKCVKRVIKEINNKRYK